ncbi:MAG: hypothetical protein BA870_09485 [Desulfuromonadales bacterium C00003094]|jgi:metal-responsive CopG/Arc/MetJ family transcriptional regulator|nr:MAG: hypothetical protein BA870_09485 [Desulfuromonadales bacterium C00003094]OEU71959.1 MAG: hypothetical protein BA869_03590 [Desulfuromonadales bacterium C00003107]
MTRFNANNGGLLQKKITVRLDEHRLAELEQIARREGFSISLLVRHLVHRFLEERKRYGGLEK